MVLSREERLLESGKSIKKHTAPGDPMLREIIFLSIVDGLFYEVTPAVDIFDFAILDTAKVSVKLSSHFARVAIL